VQRAVARDGLTHPARRARVEDARAHLLLLHDAHGHRAQVRPLLGQCQKLEDLSPRGLPRLLGDQVLEAHLQRACVGGALAPVGPPVERR